MALPPATLTKIIAERNAEREKLIFSDISACNVRRGWMILDPKGVLRRCIQVDLDRLRKKVFVDAGGEAIEIDKHVKVKHVMLTNTYSMVSDAYTEIRQEIAIRVLNAKSN